METMSSSSSSCVPQEPSTCDEISMHQSLLISDTIKDLKNLRAQLYSAAEYFEVSYANDDRKEIVVNTLKDYAVRAIVNTVDHLGSASSKVNGILDEKVDEASVTELRVACIEQRLQTCQQYTNFGGLSQQSLVIPSPKHHKRYILPVEESISGSSPNSVKQRSFSIDNIELQQLQIASQKMTRDPPPSIRKERAPSPSPQPRACFSKEKRAVSPLPTSRMFRSGSLSSRPSSPRPSNTPRSTTPNSSSTRRRHAPEPQRLASLNLPAERGGNKDSNQHSSKSKRLLKALLSRRKSKNDPELYTYLDEY